MRQRRIQPVNHRNRENRVEILAIPVVGAGRQNTRIDRARAGIAAQFAAAIDQACDNAGRFGKLRVEQQRFHRAADTGAAHLGIERDHARHRRIGGGMNIGVADAVEMGEHRHPRIGLHPRHQALAAARDNHIDQARRRQHRADRSAVLGGDQLHCSGWHTGFGQPFGQRSVDRPVGMHRLAAAAQHHRVTRTQAQRGGVRGDVRPALVYDPDKADRDAHPAQAKSVGPLAAVDRLTDRIGERGDLFDRIGNPGEAGGVELQPVKHGPGEAVGFPGGQIEGVGGEDFDLGVAQSLGTGI